MVRGIKFTSILLTILMCKKFNYFRHEKYYVFITNGTGTVGEQNTLRPVYQDKNAKPSFQNTIIFPGGHLGHQIYILVNRTNNSDVEHTNIVELCEAEVYGCVTNGDIPDCNCLVNTKEENQDLELWESRFAFGTGNVTLRCDRYYLSIMNLTGQNERKLVSILEACDGKQQCTFPTSQDLKNKSISFYCTDRCLNEEYNNTVPVSQLMEDSDIRYRFNVSNSFTASLKSLEFKCWERHVLTSGNLTLQCERGGRWIGEAPICNVTCPEPVHDNTTTIRQTPSFSYYFLDHSVSYTCNKHHRLVEGNLTRVCNESGDWTEDQPVCKRCKCPCYRLRSQNFITDPRILQNRIDETRKKLEVNAKAVSATKRKKSCAKDERKSARGIGSVLGIGIIAFVMSIIVCSDLPLLCRHIRYGP